MTSFLKGYEKERPLNEAERSVALEAARLKLSKVLAHIPEVIDREGEFEMVEWIGQHGDAFMERVRNRSNSESKSPE